MEISHFLCLHLLVILVFFEPALSADADVYSEALLSLKKELFDDQNSLSDWILSPGGETSPEKVTACSWSGVSCNENSTSILGLDLSRKGLGGELSGKQFSVFKEVTSLNLSYNSFSGQLPVGIFNLSGLRTLDVSRNNFSGHFPSGVSGLSDLGVLDAFSNSFSGPVPVELSKLEHLKVLNLAGSYFSGPIPSEFGSFKSLEFLHLAGNSLSGKIPPELGKLQTVTHMEIGYNSYEGSIPWQLGNMSAIEYLDVADANLSGLIPSALSNLTKLQSLFLFKNMFTGLIPGEFSRMISLTDLDLSDNLISGPIPKSFSEMKNLRLLSLMYNEMNGTVPEGIADLPSLETLLIWNNYFTGSLPRSLGKNMKLKYIDVSTNSLVGAVPPDICSGGVLIKLILFSNKFAGSLPPSLANCSSLVRLRLEDNSFSGEISLTFSLLPEITYIDLSRNNFTGGVPADIYRASKLQYFNISYNLRLGGFIPEGIWSLPFLQNFSASSCNISGNIPSFDSCGSVSVIELNGNSLFQSLPKSVSRCQALERIDMSNNHLTGLLPKELANLRALRVLDLSHNNFTGPIPAKLGDLSSLQYLNVSYNDFTGSIPSEKVFKSMDGSAFAGNMRLCGEPLRQCPGSVAILGSKGIGKLMLVLLLCLGLVVSIVAFTFGLFYFRKGNKGRWKMVYFVGLPRFTASDILKSFSSAESIESTTSPPALVCKALLPTGITVLVKNIEWDPKRMKAMMEFITRMGNARHVNLIRLLGFCYNKQMAYLLYDYLPNGNLAEKMRIKRDWSAKYRIVMGVARGLCFLHHDCFPAMPHGDLKSSNVVFDENMEPRLTEFGLTYLVWMNKGSAGGTVSNQEADNNATREQLQMDVYNFGEIVLEVLTNGRSANAAGSIRSKPRDVLAREILAENEVSTDRSLQEEIKLVLEVALLCIQSRASDRPSIGDALKLLSELKPPRK
ncbi:leucine-rich repeat receptor-like protein kinase TDR [Rhodamnia argentea]|uniref:Leucine-rich repeat receptor-like protein kinase TDR n=1 Tax=Rhodamnia argentea TaxID=178133 RepID=A0A8B8QK94_9MYRT|nr:leucine-rich repeat receptor-like protein kinase TDR [Rhodamnia argentea]